MESSDGRRDTARDPRSTPALLADLFSETTSLFGKEARLLRTELSEKVTQGVTALALMIGGAVFLIGAVNVVLAAAVTALIEAGIAAPWSSLIVAAVVGLAGWLLVRRGLRNLKPENLSPSRTANQLKRDVALAKEQLQ